MNFLSAIFHVCAPSAASNILNLPAARTLQLENVHIDLSALGIHEAKVTSLFNTVQLVYSEMTLTNVFESCSAAKMVFF